MLLPNRLGGEEALDGLQIDSEFGAGAHGLKAAQLMQPYQSDGDGFAAVPGWGSGVILMDRGGRPIAIDAKARSIFQQMGVLDGVRVDAFASRPVRDALDYVSHALKNIFHAPEGGSSTADAPVYRLYYHRAGIVLRLHGVQMFGSEGPNTARYWLNAAKPLNPVDGGC
jgi:hypothetical protein